MAGPEAAPPHPSAAAAIIAAGGPDQDLPALRKDLGRQHREIEQQIEALITSEFSTFTQLSTDLERHESQLSGLLDRIGSYSASIDHVHTIISDSATQLAAKLEERNALQKLAKELRLLQRLAHLRDHFETLLTTECAAGGGSECLLRAAQLSGRMRSLRHRGSQLAAVQASAYGWKHANELLLSQLCGSLGTALECDDRPQIIELMQAFTEAGFVHEAAEWIRAHWLAQRMLPKLESAAASADSIAFGSICTAALEFARGEEWSPLMQPEIAALRPHLHLLANALWEETCRFLGNVRAHLLGAGMPEAFHSAFVALSRLRGALEEMLPSTADVRYLRTHLATADLMKRFNLPIYYQLRVQEVAAQLERSLSVEVLLQPTPSTEATGEASGEAPQEAHAGLPPSPRLRTEPPTALLVAVRRCLAPTVMLKQLSSRFLRLVLQCLSRYNSWLLQVVETRGVAPTVATSSTPTAVTSASPTAAASATPTAAASATSTSTAHAAAIAAVGAPQPAQGHTLHDALFALYFDTELAIEWLRQTLAPAIGPLLELPASHPLNEECSRALLDGCEAISASQAQLQGLLTSHLSAQCCALLAPVRALKASFRMSGRELPSSPSYFVSEVMRPLRECLGQFGELLLPPQRAQWALQVSARVTKHYLTLASSLLETVRKNEDALRRLNAKKAATPSGNQASDSHKISVQLFLDVGAFGQQLGELGVEIAELPEYAQLQAAVRPKAQAREGEAEQGDARQLQADTTGTAAASNAAT
mgnify:CR=1 FL=1|jgi:hypothetical protein